MIGHTDGIAKKTCRNKSTQMGVAAVYRTKNDEVKTDEDRTAGRRKEEACRTRKMRRPCGLLNM
jgi:hypothetical protein